MLRSFFRPFFRLLSYTAVFFTRRFCSCKFRSLCASRATYSRGQAGGMMQAWSTRSRFYRFFSRCCFPCAARALLRLVRQAGKKVEGGVLIEFPLFIDHHLPASRTSFYRRRSEGRIVVNIFSCLIQRKDVSATFTYP